MRISLVETKELDCREALNVIWLAYALICCHIHSTDINYALESLGNLFPGWLHFLTMTAPGSVEFNEPKLVRVQNLTSKVSFSKFNNFLAIFVHSKTTRGKKCH